MRNIQMRNIFTDYRYFSLEDYEKDIFEEFCEKYDVVHFSTDFVSMLTEEYEKWIKYKTTKIRQRKMKNF